MESTNKPNPYDIYHPRPGHEDRFARKLEKSFGSKNPKKISKYIWIAAVFILFVSLGFLSFPGKNGNTEQDRFIHENTGYFSKIIDREVKLLQKNQNPETRALINETMKQLEQLEKEYQTLLEDYKHNNENKNLLNALIENFQKRIELLQFTKFQLNEIQNLKTGNHEQNKA